MFPPCRLRPQSPRFLNMSLPPGRPPSPPSPGSNLPDIRIAWVQLPGPSEPSGFLAATEAQLRDVITPHVHFGLPPMAGSSRPARIRAYVQFWNLFDVGLHCQDSVLRAIEVRWGSERHLMWEELMIH
ncbi:hypothetical protein CALVIDRAFT_415458 [Calocera viscosa TUFC12733]|uniref:Uncharacterized protein n=1 Tax=Calocera viscosa (strain TUFC12733) TaxID=1330018 RepID=A0A167G1H6_CALVF|nr:hypothetical protein CALVIDRAFT_415458 [Calocera viscosa TUFC12733]